MLQPSNPPRPVETLAETAAVCVAATLAVAMLNLAPGLETRLQSELGLRPLQVGLFFMAELGAMALASVVFVPAARRLGQAGVARLGLALWIGGQLGSWPLSASWGGLLAMRVVSGLGAGALMLIALDAAGRRARPQRLLAAIVAAQILGGAGGLALLPLLFGLGGLAAVFVWHATLGTAAFGLVRPLVRGARLGSDRPAATPAPRTAAALSIGLAAFCFNVAIGALWTFVPEYAPRGVEAASLPPLLAQATLFGIAGAAASALCSRHLRPRHGSLAGIAALAASAVVLHLATEPAAFTLACFAVSFAWTFGVPQVLGLGAAGPDGRSSMPVINAAFALGLAAGPLAGGALFEAQGPGGLTAGVLVALALSAAAARARR